MAVTALNPDLEDEFEDDVDEFEDEADDEETDAGLPKSTAKKSRNPFAGMSLPTMPKMPNLSLPQRKPATPKAAKAPGTGKPLGQHVVGFLTTLAQSRVLFWIGYAVIALATMYVAFVRGLYYSRMGVPGHAVMLDPIMNELTLYGQFIIPFLAYVLFAVPMDTIPGKGKGKELLGDVLVASSFFTLYKAGYAAVFCADIFLRGAGIGINASEQARISSTGGDFIVFGALFIGQILFMRWLMMRRPKP